MSIEITSYYNVFIDFFRLKSYNVLVKGMETYPYYWKKKWNKKKPNWIVKENENWEGNYIVKYWAPEWKNIIKEYQKKLDEIGVDGYLLDTVDTFQYFEENYKKTLE